MLGEPWNMLLFLVFIPILIQFYKIWKDKGGAPLSKLALQIISLVISGAFTLLSGGFVGLLWPALPIWTGDTIIFIVGVITFAGEIVAVVTVAFGTIQALYELVYKRIFEMIGFGPKEKVANRKLIGFWA